MRNPRQRKQLVETTSEGGVLGRISMTDMRRLEQLLECMVQILGRASLPEERVREAVGDGPKQLKAFNLADGTRTQAMIAKATGLDQGNLSRVFRRWVESGAAFWLGEGKEARLLHIYALRGTATSRPSKPRSKKRIRSK